MTDPSPCLFKNDVQIRRIGEGLLDRSLPRADWTHEAHLAACYWIVTERPDIDPENDLRGIISGYNEAVGGVNDDTQGYHETITCCFVRAVRLHLAVAGKATLVERVNALLASPFGKRGWPLAFYSRELLFSCRARRLFVQPDLMPLPPLPCGRHLPTVTIDTQMLTTQSETKGPM
jgi:hypothetical protein